MISASELNERMRVAAEDGNEEEVHALIERGADIQHKDDYGLTSLILACCEGHLDIAQLLIERGEIQRLRTMMAGLLSYMPARGATLIQSGYSQIGEQTSPRRIVMARRRQTWRGKKVIEMYQNVLKRQSDGYHKRILDWMQKKPKQCQIRKMQCLLLLLLPLPMTTTVTATTISRLNVVFVLQIVRILHVSHVVICVCVWIAITSY